jgi:transcription elongation factor Elf1
MSARQKFMVATMDTKTTITCKVCGSRYVRRYETVNVPDKGEKHCEVCGELLESWDGSRIPTFRLVMRGKPPKS